MSLSFWSCTWSWTLAKKRYLPIESRGLSVGSGDTVAASEGSGDSVGFSEGSKVSVGSSDGSYVSVGSSDGSYDSVGNSEGASVDGACGEL